MTCSDRPCLHGQCTDRGSSGFLCKCNVKYTGHTCNTRKSYSNIFLNILKKQFNISKFFFGFDKQIFYKV